ncbi:thiaminase II [Macrococcus epidermidis]|uniref:Aminopyrimidine aminohydrolase n=1 Tax=Macrococcus epidermidis TaxID=1902580 RepID=A0A327ZY11_9STAP|nr:thiaminase II [Macrococcus epidermidis]RAK46414.1 thiaminase II [Macrococcus epidermidis]
MFTERIWKRVEPIWSSYLEHSFVKGLGDGTLSNEKFQHWLKQDYVYLIEYAKLMAIGSAKSRDLSTMSTFANLLHGTLFMEMDLHRKFAASYGISSDELEATDSAATNTAYTSYMLNHAQRGGAEHVVACLLACAWSYNFIGKSLAEKGGLSQSNPYHAWVETYSGEEFTDLTNDAIRLMDELTEGKPEAELAELEEIIVKTSYYEYMFWDMCENLETWNIPQE